MVAIVTSWVVVVGGLALLQAIRAGEEVAEVAPPPEETSIAINFHDENNLGPEDNREVIALAAEVVQLVGERGFRVEEVIVPRGFLREFNLVMSRQVEGGEGEIITQFIRLRCSTERLATATAADAIYVFDRWLDGEIEAAIYIDIRISRRAFYQ